MKHRDLILVAVAILSVAGVAFFLKLSVVPPPPQLSAENIPVITARYAENVRTRGAVAAFAAFKKEMASASPNTAHSYSHLFGKALFESAGLDGVQACDSSFQYGCYHGFFIAAVSAEGLAVVSKLDGACMSSGSGYLPCQHGIGHGILEFLGHDKLTAALMECANIQTDPIGGCSSGVFMEYNTPLTTGSEGSVTLSVRPFDSGHADAPCPSVPSRFRSSCYHELPQWWAAVFGQDFKKAGVLCDGVSDTEGRTQCFQGLGLSAAPALRYDVNRIASLCDAMPKPDEAGLCRAGAAWVVKHFSGEAAAQQLCAALDPDVHSFCPPL
jgi:hypothetical protein